MNIRKVNIIRELKISNKNIKKQASTALDIETSLVIFDAPPYILVCMTSARITPPKRFYNLSIT